MLSFSVHLKEDGIQPCSVNILPMSNNVEQRFFYIWSGVDFPYINVLSVVSTLHHHPKATVDVYIVGERPLTAWFEVLENLQRVTIRLISGFDLIGQLPPHLHEVEEAYNALSPSAHSARSNVLRYAILYLYGGVYLDFDVFVLRPMDPLFHLDAFAGEELVWADDVPRLQGKRFLFARPRNILWSLSHAAMWCDSHVFGGRLRVATMLTPSFRFWSKYQMNNAVLGAAAGSEFVEELLMGVIEADVRVRYSTGPTLVESVTSTTSTSVNPLPADCFYSVPPGQSYRLFFDETLQLPDNAFLIHYAASNHAARINELVPSRIHEWSPRTVMGASVAFAHEKLQDMSEISLVGAAHA